MRYFLLVFLLAIGGGDSKVTWLTPMEHDFGDIVQKEAVSFSFMFKNVSDTPILIDNVRTTCGCTAPDWTYDAIAPDSTSAINVVFDAKRQGYFRKKIMVFFSGQRRCEKLYIEGYVE